MSPWWILATASLYFLQCTIVLSLKVWRGEHLWFSTLLCSKYFLMHTVIILIENAACRFFIMFSGFARLGLFDSWCTWTFPDMHPALHGKYRPINMTYISWGHPWLLAAVYLPLWGSLTLNSLPKVVWCVDCGQRTMQWVPQYTGQDKTLTEFCHWPVTELPRWSVIMQQSLTSAGW